MKTACSLFTTSALTMAFASLILSGNAWADTTETTWNGGSTAWGTGTNWANGTGTSSTVSAEFNSVFTNQPSLGSTPATAQGIWLTTGVSGTTTIGGTATLTITGNATLNAQTNAGIYMNDANNNSLTINAPITLTNSTGFYNQESSASTLTIGALNLNGKALTVGLGATSTGNITFNGNITGGAGSITANTASTSTVTFNGTNSNTGALSTKGGTYNLYGSFNSASSVSLGGTVNLYDTTDTNAGLGTGNLTLVNTINNASGQLLTIGNNLTTALNSPIFTGSSMTFTGGWTVTSNANKTVTNNLSSGQTLTFSTNAFNLSNASTRNVGYTLTGTGNTTISAPIQDYSSGLSATGSDFLVTNSGTTRLSGANQFGGSSGTAATFTINASTGTVIYSGSNTGSISNTTLTSGTLQIQNNNTNGGLGSGTLSLSGGTLQNTYGGTLTLANPVTLGGNSTISGSNSITLSGSVNQSATTARTLTNSLSGGTLTLSGTNINLEFTSGTAQTLTLAGTGNTTISSAIADFNGTSVATGGSLTITNTGTTTLSGTNVYTGKTTISNGTVEFGQKASLYNGTTGSWTGTNIIVKSGATLALAVGASSPQFTTSDITSLLGMTSSATAGFETGSSLGLDTTAASISYGPIANAYSGSTLGLNKLGTNTLTLTGTNSYTGATQVNGGVLSVTGSLNAGSTVTVGGSAASNSPTLNGTGTINGNVIVASAGTGVAGKITPGTSASPTGTLNIGGTISFQVGSTFTDSLSGANAGELIIGGTATVASGALISISGTPIAGNSYTLATAAGGGFSGTNGGFTLTGTPLPTGWQIVVTGGGANLVLNQSVTGTSYTVVTTPAPTVVLHQNATTTLTTTITNIGTGTADTLDYASLGATSSLGNGLSPSGTSGSNLANNSAGTASNAQTYTATNTGTDTITNTGVSGTNHSGSVPAASGSYTGTTVVVYSGQGTWTGGSGSWGTPVASPTNWTSPGGVPGLAGGSFNNTDSATFGTTSSQINVALNGQSPFLNTVTFNNTTVGSGYTIAQGSGGTLHLSGTGSPATANITNTAGNNTISAPVELDTAVAASVARSGDTLTISGAISEAGGSKSFSKSGPGVLVLSSSSGSTYSGGTTVSAGKVYVNNTTGSGTGSGSVSVSNSGTVLAGKGSIAGAVTLGAGTTLYSGGVVTGSPVVSANTSSSTTGLTLSSSLGINSANLTFALGTDTTSGSGAYNFANPSYNSTYMNVGGVITFSGSDSISLVDLTNTTGTNGTLSLRLGQPYILISDSLGNAGFSGLVTMTGSGANAVYSLDQNGWVVGVAGAGWTPANGATNVTAIQINQFGADGVTPLAAGPNGIYTPVSLYLSNGNLEVVPEPGTWALMLGGLALLVFIQRRKSKN